MRSAAALALLAATGCGVVQGVTIRDDYDAAYKKSLLRLAVVTAPLPAGDPEAGAMWSKMARRYTNHHRDFIAKRELSGPTIPEGACADGIDGLLHLAPQVTRADGGAEIEVTGRLTRCADGVEIWRAEVSGSWPSDDPNVSTVIEEYGEEHGDGVRPLIAPSFHALRALLDTLPRPVLEDDDDIMEKIELGE